MPQPRAALRRRPRPLRGRRGRRFALVLAGLVAALMIAAAAAALLVDPRVELAGIDVGGRSRGGMTAAAETVAARYADAEVVVETPDGDLQTTAEELGLRVDVDATVEAALTSEGGLLDRLRSQITPRNAPVVVTVDEEQVADVVAERDPTDRREPVEPAVTSDDGDIGIRPGRPGEGLDPDVVADAVVEAARDGELPIRAEVEPSPLPPRFSKEDARELAARAQELVADPLPVAAGETRAEISSEMLASWIASEATEAGLEITLKGDDVLDDLRDVLDDAGDPPVDARFTVEGGRPVIVRGRNGTRCCEVEAVDRIREALDDRPATPVALPMEPVAPDRTSADLQELRIVEDVGSFTTRFQSGQPRVVNIHRIADIVRGTLIGPGGRLSINDKVGKRTTEKGFVSGGVIHDGMFTESVGGGISQFATTLFNAAFFGGLEIPEYQSHSIYISRYPYGREATLSYPKPDLVIQNPTPYGVLVWPTYTSSSITVTLYSTRWATGEQTAQSETKAGECTRVRTERTRTFVDGRKKTDLFYATYRPEEGVRC